ncbi:MAG TPA: hypothetical protein VNL13_02275 [Sulfolobales archaeon]|nr:hypothetical protein [Sulfolobales archaeon]
MVVSRDFCLAHRDLGIPMGSWVAVESKGTWLPSSFAPGGLERCLHHHSGLVWGDPHQKYSHSELIKYQVSMGRQPSDMPPPIPMIPKLLTLTMYIKRKQPFYTILQAAYF